MALRRGSLHLLGSVLQAARSSGELPATLKPTLQPSSLRNCQLVLKAAGTQVAAGLTSQAQYSIIKPAGAGGPVVRTAVYAIFELGSAQFKVSAGDLIYVERLVGVDVGAELALKRVQAAGSRQETLVGRPYVSGASITAVVEEQVQDAKVISFKKRRRKNSRRTKGHRQYLTGLRITGINGILAPADTGPQGVVA